MAKDPQPKFFRGWKSCMGCNGQHVYRESFSRVAGFWSSTALSCTCKISFASSPFHRDFLTLGSDVGRKETVCLSMQLAGDGPDTPKQGAASLPGGSTTTLLHSTSIVAISLLLLLPTGIIYLLGDHNFGKEAPSPLMAASAGRFERALALAHSQWWAPEMTQGRRGFFDE